MPITDFIATPRFPEDIAYGSAGGPGFKTNIFEGHDGQEHRNVVWSVDRGRWDVSYGIRDKVDMDLVRNFFRNARGRAVGFRFKDFSDFQVVNENFGTGNGALTTFRLKKTYTLGASTYSRRVYKPVAGVVIQVNSVTVPQGVGATQVNLDYETGVAVFGGSVIPGIGLPITWTGEFDVPVRFDTDQMSAAHDGFETESWGSIPLVEIRMNID